MLRIPCIGCRISLTTAVCFVVLCASFASAQTPGDKSKQAQARAKALNAEGMSALRYQDLAVGQAEFEKLIRVVPRSPVVNNTLGWVCLYPGQLIIAGTHYYT